MADNTVSIQLTLVAKQLQEGIQQGKTAIQSLAEETKATTEKAKASLGLLSEEFGVKMPGEVQNLVAQLPGVGTALKAAFSASVVIAILQALVEIAQKIETVSQRAEKNREAWASIQTAMDETTEKTAIAIDKQKAKYIEMTQGPMKAMEYGLQHIHSTALAAFSSISSELEKVGHQFEEAGGWWTDWQRANKEAGKDTKKTLADIQVAMHDAAKAAPKDPFAPFNAGIEATQNKIDELKRKIADPPVTTNWLGWVVVNEKAVAVLNQEKEALTTVNNQLKDQKDLQQKIIDNDKQSAALANVKDRIAANTQILSAAKNVEDAKRKLAEDTARFEVQTGKITAEQAEEIEKAALNKELEDTKKNLKEKQRLQLQDSSLTGNQRRAIIQTTNKEIEAAVLKHEDDLLKIKEEANQRTTRDFLVQVQSEVVATKAGSKARVDAYKDALDKMRQMGLAGLAEFRALEEQYNTAAHEYKKKQIKDTLDQEEEAAHHTEQMALMELDVRRKVFENETILHKKKSSEIIAQEQAFLKEELSIKVTALKAKLAAMEKDPDINANERKRIQDQILELQKQYELKAINIKKDEVNRKKQLEQAFQSTLQSGFSSGIMGMLKGTETFAQAMKDIYAGLVQDVVNMLAEMAAEWISTHLLMKLFGISTGKETAASNIMASASSGAAAAGSSVAAIPVIGWSMVEPVSMATYGMLSAYAAGIAGFELGGVVPQTGLALVHSGETILPQSMSGKGFDGGIGGTAVHVHMNVNAIDSASFKDTVGKHGHMIGELVTKALKKKGIK